MHEEMSDFEVLLQNKRNALNSQFDPPKQQEGTYEIPYTKADKGASLDDFLAMVKKIVTKTMKKDGVIFIPDDAIQSKDLFDPQKDLEHPFIFYTLISRAPRSNELKPKVRQDINERNPDGSIARQGTIFAQIMDCEIQFNIVASDYSTANRVMNAFEGAMLNCTGYFKQNGVSELLFVKQYTDSNLDIYRQKMSVRSLVYHVVIENIHLAFDTTIAEIDQMNS
jgi:hypothetical protein